MSEKKFYELPELPYAYNALVPYISEEVLKLHHDKHHAAYVKGANDILEKMDKANAENAEIDLKARLKELAFHLGGQKLHKLYWKCMAPIDKGGGAAPGGMIGQLIKEEYGSFERFKKLFTQTASSVEGSGWAVLAYCKMTQRAILMQVEKHNVNVYPGYKLLLVLDVWEHAYYLDYKNDRAKYIDAWWNVVDWSHANKMLEWLKEK